MKKILLLAFLWSTAAFGSVAIDAPGPSNARFRTQVQQALAALARSPDKAIRALDSAADASPATITIRPITNDRRTWHKDGDRTRAHTESADGAAKSRGRTVPTQAIIFLPPDVVDPGEKRWKSGVLVHELVHAVDLAYGRYHSDVALRERRAVFMQNIWRARMGHNLRKDYQDRFPTLDYQESIRRKTLDDLLRYIFTRSDFPSAK